MSLVRYEPFSLFDRFDGALSPQSLMYQFFNDAGKDMADTASQWRPAVDIKEEDSRYVIYADLPGVDVKDIEVTMDGGVLTLKGERRHSNEQQHRGYKRLERSQGEFRRYFSLPDSTDAENIEAESRDGVLQIVIPKQEKLQPRKITVKG